MPFRVKSRRLAAGAAVLLLIGVVYLLTAQRDINQRSESYIMMDTGEIQIALNLWGTLHHTGYPLYSFLGSALTMGFRFVGFNPALSASLVSAVFGLAALGTFYALLTARGTRPPAAFLLTAILGLTRSFWVHSVIAEVYTLGFFLAVLALWWIYKDDRNWKTRDWLIAALLLGLGVGHHRSGAFIIPGVAIRLLPQIWRQRRRALPIFAGGALIFLASFAVYVYLPLRDWMGAPWLYGQPGTWAGFWDLFWGIETGRSFQGAGTLTDWIANAELVLSVLVGQVTWPGLIIGSAAWGFLVVRAETRRTALMLGAGAAVYLVFAAWLPGPVHISAFLIPVVMMLLMVVGEALTILRNADLSAWFYRGALLAGAALVIFLLWNNRAYVRAFTDDETGRHTIEHLQTLPLDSFEREPVVMLPWGGTYFAMNYGLLVTGELSGFMPVDHRANMAAILARGDPLITLPDTFYVFPLPVWDEWLGEAAHLTSIAPGFVRIGAEPILPPVEGEPIRRMENGVSLAAYDLSKREDGSYHLVLYWRAERVIDRDASVFVHMTRTQTPDSGDDILSQADSAAPVYGWYPVTRWEVGEIVRDDVVIVPPQDYEGPLFLRVGMYRQLEDGSFQNFEALNIPLEGVA